MFVNELMCLQHGCEEGWATLFYVKFRSFLRRRAVGLIILPAELSSSSSKNVSFTVQTRGILTSAGLRWPPVWIDMCACMNMMSLENHQSPA